MTAAAVPAFSGLAEGAPATSPPEARGLARDGVRMLVASASAGLRPTVVRQLPAVLRPGDLVFFDGLGHVGLYIGHGRIIHAPQSGERVSIQSLASRSGTVEGARRLMRS